MLPTTAAKMDTCGKMVGHFSNILKMSLLQDNTVQHCTKSTVYAKKQPLVKIVRFVKFG